MARSLRFLPILIAVFALFPGSTGTTDEAATFVPAELAPYQTPSPAKEALVDDVLARFADHDMAIASPPLVSFHDELDACGGNLAYWRNEEDVDHVRICWTHEDPGVEAIVQTQALTHEFGHAWVYENTDAQTRAAFVDRTGSTSWADPADDWNDRATERAADLIVWAILDPGALFVDFSVEPCTTWIDAFELLTGRSAPASITDCSAGR
ncbi:MAG: hypothetical protein AAF081_08090 [Actinomycetota bacterium]